jgi:hypothetical protein
MASQLSVEAVPPAKIRLHACVALDLALGIPSSACSHGLADAHAQVATTDQQ